MDSGTAGTFEAQADKDSSMDEAADELELEAEPEPEPKPELEPETAAAPETPDEVNEPEPEQAVQAAVDADLWATLDDDSGHNATRLQGLFCEPMFKHVLGRSSDNAFLMTRVSIVIIRRCGW